MQSLNDSLLYLSFLRELAFFTCAAAPASGPLQISKSWFLSSMAHTVDNLQYSEMTSANTGKPKPLSFNLTALKLEYAIFVMRKGEYGPLKT